MQQDKKHFSIFSFNPQSIVNNVDTLEYLLLTYDPDIVIITETWLRNTISDNKNIPPGYTLVRTDRHTGGSAVALVIKDVLRFVVLDGIQSHESVWCRIITGETAVIIGGAYRPPGASLSYMARLYDNVLSIKK